MAKTKRSSLKLDRVYFESKSEQYFVTEDGEGCVWFDSKDEALEVGDGPVIRIAELEA